MSKSPKYGYKDRLKEKRVPQHIEVDEVDCGMEFSCECGAKISRTLGDMDFITGQDEICDECERRYRIEIQFTFYVYATDPNDDDDFEGTLLGSSN